ncbi:MAG: 50S ribosomal protein L6 [Verrucomicrobia subdivision 3 bacterium]|nr:50S ribosomal protein L6 [Limisphaerales bacterium]MCS1415987.1 50S ribosomal protein L6 [Limisphaerales bacterium]
MSRIGKTPILVPAKVKVAIKGQAIDVEGPNGKLSWEAPKRTKVVLKDSNVVVQRDGDDKEAKAQHGLARSLVNNMVIGVSRGFVKELEIQGVGFKAAIKGKAIELNLGYSHQINYSIPKGVKVSVAEGTNIKIEGPDKQVVGRVAAEIRGFYPPEPYKGKGVRYKDERVIRKEGKTVQ